MWPNAPTTGIWPFATSDQVKKNKKPPSVSLWSSKQQRISSFFRYRSSYDVTVSYTSDSMRQSTACIACIIRHYHYQIVTPSLLSSFCDIINWTQSPAAEKTTSRFQVPVSNDMWMHRVWKDHSHKRSQIHLNASCSPQSLRSVLSQESTSFSTEYHHVEGIIRKRRGLQFQKTHVKSFSSKRTDLFKMC